RGRAELGEVLPPRRNELRVVLAVPHPDRSPRRGAGRAGGAGSGEPDESDGVTKSRLGRLGRTGEVTPLQPLPPSPNLPNLPNVPRLTPSTAPLPATARSRTESWRRHRPSPWTSDEGRGRPPRAGNAPRGGR